MFEKLLVTQQSRDSPLLWGRKSSYIPVAALSKAWLWGRSLAEIVGSKPAGGMNVCLLWVFSIVR
jgi:hypothetical protein